jgi:hypothetical protein
MVTFNVLMTKALSPTKFEEFCATSLRGHLVGEY